MPKSETSRIIRVAFYTRNHHALADLYAYTPRQADWQFTGLLFDDRCAGSVVARPALGRAVTAAVAGRYDVLLAPSPMILSRSATHLRQVLDRLDRCGVSVQLIAPSVVS